MAQFHFTSYQTVSGIRLYAGPHPNYSVLKMRCGIRATWYCSDFSTRF